MINEILNKGCNNLYYDPTYSRIRNTERSCYQNIDIYLEWNYKPSLALELLCSNCVKTLVYHVLYFDFHSIDSKYKIFWKYSIIRFFYYFLYENSCRFILWTNQYKKWNVVCDGFLFYVWYLYRSIFCFLFYLKKESKNISWNWNSILKL